MKTVFADTAYYVALLVPQDETYFYATAFTADFDGQILSTTHVLTELAAYFSKPPDRARFCSVVKALRTDASITILHVDQTLFERGWSFFAQHRDKEWSLTDCISFIVMKDRAITDALTTDHHFEQAGFSILL